MIRLLQPLLENGRLLAQKSALVLLLAGVFVFTEGCSKKMPCPDAFKASSKATAKASKSKKKKAVKAVNPDAGGSENVEASGATLEEAATETKESTDGKAKSSSVAGTKNKYSKNGLIQKNKYKRLRSDPSHKTTRVKKKSIFSIFSKK